MRKSFTKKFHRAARGEVGKTWGHAQKGGNHVLQKIKESQEKNPGGV